MELFNHHFEKKELSINHKISEINKLFAKHEECITNPILQFIDDNKNLNLIGKNKILNKNRAPTISFTSHTKTSKEVSDILLQNKIATRNDNFYAWRCLKAMNISTIDGVVRSSLVHYNSMEDTKRIIKALEKL